MEWRASIGQTVGLLLIPLLLGIVLFNGAAMLVSPAWWFGLPRYIAFRGSLEAKFAATWFGRLQIRALGLILGSAAAWMIASFFGFTYGSAVAGPIGVPIGQWLSVATCIAVIGCGGAMLLKPRWWMARYFRGSNGNQIALERVLRIISVPTIAVGLYFLLQCNAVQW